MIDLKNNAVKAAVLIGGGLLVMRLAMARSLMDGALALGVAGLELGAVAALEAKAQKLEAEIVLWRKSEDARVLLGAARAERKRRGELAQESRDEQAALLDEIEFRSKNGDTEAAKRRAIAEARAGYIDRISQNRAHGVAPKETEI
jgi:hypothetical protein